MYQPDANPILAGSSPALAAIDCPCGWRTPAEPPARRWLVASHLASHEPDELVLVPSEEGFELLLVLARARGVAEIAAPHLGGDLDVAAGVLAAADIDGRTDYALPTRLVGLIVETARGAACVLRSVAHRREVADELEEAAAVLARCLGATGKSPGKSPRRSSSLTDNAPQIRPAATPELALATRLALEVVARPLLLELPPFTGGSGTIEGRAARDLVGALFGLAPSLRDLEGSLKASLSRVAHRLLPLPVVTEAFLDDLAELVVELQLAILAISHLGELLATCVDEAVASWSAATSETLLSRLRSLAEHATRVLEVLDRPA